MVGGPAKYNIADDNPSLKFSNLYIYPDPLVSNSTCIDNDYALGNYPIILDITNGDCLASGQRALIFSAGNATSPATINLSNFRIRAWNQSGTGAHAMLINQYVTVFSNVNPSQNNTAYANLVDGTGRLWYPGKGQTSSCPCWQEDADGTLHEWGLAITSGGTATITFAQPFTSAVNFVSTSPALTSAPASTLFVTAAPGPISLTGFTAYVRFDSSGTIGAAGENVFWQAVGK